MEFGRRAGKRSRRVFLSGCDSNARRLGAYHVQLEATTREVRDARPGEAGAAADTRPEIGRVSSRHAPCSVARFGTRSVPATYGGTTVSPPPRVVIAWMIVGLAFFITVRTEPSAIKIKLTFG